MARQVLGAASHRGNGVFPRIELLDAVVGSVQHAFKVINIAAGSRLIEKIPSITFCGPEGNPLTLCLDELGLE